VPFTKAPPKITCLGRSGFCGRATVPGHASDALHTCRVNALCATATYDHREDPLWTLRGDQRVRGQNINGCHYGRTTRNPACLLREYGLNLPR
jgi:hypothetical protein